MADSVLFRLHADGTCEWVTAGAAPTSVQHGALSELASACSGNRAILIADGTELTLTRANVPSRQRSTLIRAVPYAPDIHSQGAFSIWERTLGDRWPISLEVFRDITEGVSSGMQTHQLAAVDKAGRVVGYIGSQIRPREDTEVSIVLLAIDPDFQRQGLGTRLLLMRR